MKRLLLITILSTIIGWSNFAKAQSPNYLWAKSIGGSDREFGSSMATDENGNSFLTGFFLSDTINFDTNTLVNNYSADIFVANYDASGNILWTKSAGGTYWDAGQGIDVDKNGNSYVTGYYRSPSISFDTITLTNIDSGYENIFVTKYDVAGNVIWAKSAGGNFRDAGKSITVDKYGNSYLTGYFQSQTINFDTITLTNSGREDFFIVKFDTAGNVLWARNAGGTYSDAGQSIAVDANGNSYVTGYFRSPTISFGHIVLTNSDTGYDDIFIVKYDAIGNVLWAKSAGGHSFDLSRGLFELNGNIYLTGYFWSDNISFGNNSLSNVSNYNTSDIFIVKYDTAGNDLWVQSAGGAWDEYSYGITVDTAGNTYITGVFQSNTVSFGNITLSNANLNHDELFIAKFDTSGNVIWAKSAGGSESDGGTSITVDKYGNTYILGYSTSAKISFGPFTLTNVDTYQPDIFVAKLDAITGLIEQPVNDEHWTVYPNPSNGRFQLIARKQQSVIKQNVTIMNFLGEIISQAAISQNSGEATFDLSSKPKGIYFISINTQQGIITKKLILQ